MAVARNVPPPDSFSSAIHDRSVGHTKSAAEPRVWWLLISAALVGVLGSLVWMALSRI